MIAVYAEGKRVVYINREKREKAEPIELRAIEPLRIHDRRRAALIEHEGTSAPGSVPPGARL
jgi:hypothetical protein